MKKLQQTILFFLVVLFSFSGFTQTPQAFNYQSVIRNSSGAIIANQNVSIQLSILANSPSGSVLYRERHNVQTNAYGIVNLKIGNGTLVSGNFSTINWQSGTKYLEVGIDVNNGTNYTIMGATQFVSVPYALYAETSGASGVIGPTGPTGPTGSTCVSLNDAYNGCSGNGSGNQIDVTHNKIDVTLPSSSTADQTLLMTIQKGSNASPATGLSISHQQHGQGVFAELTNTANMHSAIKGISKSSNTNTSAYPSAVAGVFDGSGCGVGVWGEISSSATTGSGAGLYGIASNNNFGAILSSNSYPGLNCKTASGSSQSAQIVSGNAPFTNPALQIRGWTQIDCSPSTASSVIINNLASEPTVAASAAQYGYIGTNAYPWYYLYYMNAIQVSSKETKRNIHALDRNMYELVMKDIDNIKPSFYKYKSETDVIDNDNSARYRPQFHLGLILEDTPDYLQDNTFSGIDVYALSTMSLAGVKYLKERYEQTENEMAQRAVNDFGIVKMFDKIVHVRYSQDFLKQIAENEIPVINISPNTPDVKYYIKEQNRNGFSVEISQADYLEFNWVAFAKPRSKTTNNTQYAESNIAPELLNNIRINKSVKDNYKLLRTKQLGALMELKN